MKEISQRTRHHTRRFPCSFCHKLLKSPGGLTQHKLTCSENPSNTYNPPSFTPPSQSPRHVLPFQSPSRTPQRRTPDLLLQDQNFSSPPYTPGFSFHDQIFCFPPHTPAPHCNNALTDDSPRRIRWTQKGRVNMRFHPHLDGELFVYVSY
jgi:hypothetical protein